jgi:general secretion pathway protein G
LVSTLRSTRSRNRFQRASRGLRLADRARPGRETGSTGSQDRQIESGFTLLELLIVVALIGIIAALAVPQFKHTPLKAKEAVLKEDLYILRDVIDQHFTDKGKYPSTLQDLVEAGYLRKIPSDPITGSAESWVIETVPAAEGEEAGGVYDVHSGAPGTALDGTSYTDW